MFDRLRQGYVWLRRCTHSKGFGIQSPWAYNFVCKVINNHYRFSDYDRLEKEVAGVSRLNRKLFRLYYRLADHLQPSFILDFSSSSVPCRQYLKAACASVVIENIPSNLSNYKSDMKMMLEPDIVRIGDVTDYTCFIDTVMNHVKPSTIIIIEGIRRNRLAYHQWQRWMNDERTGVSFDLYYCGLLFFDKKLYKQHYIINF